MTSKVSLTQNNYFLAWKSKNYFSQKCMLRHERLPELGDYWNRTYSAPDHYPGGQLSLCT